MQFRDFDDAATRPAMALVHDEGKLIGAEPLVAQVRRMAGEETEADIHASFLERGLDIGRGNFLHVQADPRMFGGKSPDQLRHQRDIENRDDAEMESAAHLPGLGCDFLENVLNLSENGAGVLRKDLASRREENAFAFALEKRDPQRHLEIAHLLRDIRLRDPEPVGGATKTARFLDREEVTQMPKLERIVVHAVTKMSTRGDEGNSAVGILQGVGAGVSPAT